MNKKLKVGVLGTRGIPNRYGGLEEFAEKFSIGLAEKGHHVVAYNSHFHEYQEDHFKNAEIIHKYCPEAKIGAAANFVYDYLCLKDALKRDFDVILECGHGCSVFYHVLPIHKSVVVTNVDGLEWKREKWNWSVNKVLKQLEKWGVSKSHALVSDNKGIKEYLLDEYGKESTMIPYGAEVFDNPDPTVLKKYNVDERGYFVKICRLVPENNIEPILDGYAESNTDLPFLILAKLDNSYAGYLQEKYKNNSEIRFLGGIYDEEVKTNLRYYSKLYFHGHSVGGTNPSLLEAMAGSALIVANDNEFNRSVLLDNALYFSDANDVKNHLNNLEEIEAKRSDFVNGNLKRMEEVYSWDKIVEQYESLFKDLINAKQ